MNKFNHSYKLKVKNLQLTRSRRDILSNINLQVKSGEALLLRGANGVGKTSLLMALAGYLHIETGLIDWVCENKNDDEERTALNDMHFISHQHAIKGNLTLVENLQFWADMNGGSKTDAMEALEKASLAHGANFEASNISAGQKKRLSLARLLVSKKPIWLLDEPTSALDSEGDKWVASLMDNHLDDGGLIIGATHLDLPLRKSKRIKTMGLGERK